MTEKWGTEKWKTREIMADRNVCPTRRRIVRVGVMADNSRLESVLGEGAEEDYEDS
jgi:hypothetical protein